MTTLLNTLRYISTSSYRQHIETLVYGVLSVFAYAPYQIWPLYILCLARFIHIYTQTPKNTRKALIFAVLFFVPHYMLGMGWVSESFFTIDMGWLSPIALIGLPVALSVLPVVGVLLSYKLAPHSPVMLGLCLSVAFLCQFLGQLACPWLIPGYTMPLELLQYTAWIGIEGVTVCVVMVSAFLAVRGVWIKGATLMFLALAFWGGSLRLSSHPMTDTSIGLRLVQPCIPQKIKWTPEHIRHNIYTHARLSQQETSMRIQAVIWPEAASVFDFTPHPDICASFGCAAPQGGGYLMLGSVTLNRDHHPNGMITPRNSFVVLNEDGVILGRCDKRHLLPYGEYVPWRWLMPWVSKMTAGEIDFEPGQGPRVLHIPNLPPFRPLICYEALFSREIWFQESGEPRPLWLLNITNDAWFGDTQGPYQHLKHASVRAIEQGVPMIRVANNGISAVIDAVGRTRHRLSLNEQGVLDIALPTCQALTFYARFGLWMLWMLMGLLITGMLLLKGRRTLG